MLRDKEDLDRLVADYNSTKSGEKFADYGAGKNLEWMSAREAKRLLLDKLSITEIEAERAILMRIYSLVVPIRWESFAFSCKPLEGLPYDTCKGHGPIGCYQKASDYIRSNLIVMPAIAEIFNDDDESFTARRVNWHTGDFEVEFDCDFTRDYYRITGLFLDRVSLLDSLGLNDGGATMIPSASPSALKRRGRSRSEFWDVLTVEVARRIFLGDIQPPVNATRLRSELLDWLAEQGFSPDRTTVDGYFLRLATALNAEALAP